MPRGGYNSQQRYKSAVEYVVASNGCWVWQRGKSSAGYGMLVVEGKRVLAHRVFYERECGPIPEGFELDHLCRNRACVNPAHLEPVSKQENIRRGSRVKLTKESVREIRERYAKGERQVELAREYGVAPSTISNVCCYFNWKEEDSCE